MAYMKLPPIIIEGAEIVEEYGKNFSGRVDEMNPHGFKSFLLKINDPELGQRLAADGWNIKHHTPRDGADGDEYDYLKVNINYNNPRYVPTIIWVKPNAQILMNDSNIGLLDSETFKTIDIEVVSKHWERMKESGFSAYVKTMYVVTEPKPFANKYGEPQRYDGPAVNEDLPFDVN